MRRTMTALFGAALVTFAFAGAAQAEEKSASAAPAAKQPITIEIVITQRVPRPQAAVDITRIAPSRPLAELKQPLVDRIEKTIDKSPF